MTSVYHLMCSRLIEWVHAILKQMLHRMCAERPKDWDRYLPALLFAIREVPQESYVSHLLSYCMDVTFVAPWQY